MKIRLTGTGAECRRALDLLGEVAGLDLDIRDMYAAGDGVEILVDVEVAETLVAGNGQS